MSKLRTGIPVVFTGRSGTNRRVPGNNGANLRNVKQQNWHSVSRHPPGTTSSVDARGTEIPTAEIRRQAVLDGNPIADVTSTRKINAVDRRGLAIDQAALRSRSRSGSVQSEHAIDDRVT
jgi:hypothetical protein